jgi:hypothetical protein
MGLSLKELIFHLGRLLKIFIFTLFLGFRIVILLIKATCNKQFVTTDQDYLIPDNEFYKKWPLVETESQFILEHIQQHEMSDHQEKPIFKLSTNERRRKVWKSVQALHSYSPLLTVNRIRRRRDAEIRTGIITSQQLTSELLAVEKGTNKSSMISYQHQFCLKYEEIQHEMRREDGSTLSQNTIVDYLFPLCY